MRLRLFSSHARVALAAAAIIVTGVGLAMSRDALTAARQAGRTAPQADWTCPMHPDVHQSHPGRCPICGMTLERQTPSAEAEAHGEAHESRAETANPARPGVVPPVQEDATDPRTPVEIDTRRQQLLGVRLAPAEQTMLSRSIHVPGIVRFDESRWTDITLRFEGYVRDLYVDRTGQAVRRGQQLFTVYSPDLASSLAEYRLAVQSRTSLNASASEAAKEQAGQLVEAARLRLARWQVTDDQIDAAAGFGEPHTVFRSPVSGIVMEKSIVKGMRAMPGDVLYRIVDSSVVWVEASVYEPDLGIVRTGQHGAMTFQTYPGETFNGRVTYVAPTLDAQTRTAIVRFEIANPGGRLKAGMFASLDLTVPLGRGLVVPSDAVLDSGRRRLVFVSEGNGYFEPREVTVGPAVDGRTQILQGLAEGERVAESAAFFIDSESQLRAATQGFAARPAVASTTSKGPRLSIDLTTVPEPLKAGRAALTATLTRDDGRPVADAVVTVVFAMPAMPSMNMPALRSEASLSPVGGGTYRGSIDVLSTGRWDVTVTVTHGADRLGAKQLTLIAR
jgi:RND family efflux transporter MFP subunit